MISSDISASLMHIWVIKSVLLSFDVMPWLFTMRSSSNRLAVACCIKSKLVEVGESG